VVHVVLAGLPTGLQQFPADTQTKLHELLGKLKAEVLHHTPLQSVTTSGLK